MQPRRRARGFAIQTLYEVDCAGHDPKDVLDMHLKDNPASPIENKPLSPAAIQFTRDLVKGVLANQHEIDRLIARHAPEWPVDQMAIIDRNVLRIAIFELAANDGTPVKVAINEAVELAKLYGSDSSARFVNGVLGTLVERLDEIRRELQIS